MILGNIFGPDVVIVLVIALVLLFGAGQLPKLARSVGEASRELRRNQQEVEQVGEGGHGTSPADRQITLSKAEVEAMIADREANSRTAGPTT
jgi:TatA/E family protein of Tat protein translocase